MSQFDKHQEQLTQEHQLSQQTLLTQLIDVTQQHNQQQQKYVELFKDVQLSQQTQHDSTMSQQQHLADKYNMQLLDLTRQTQTLTENILSNQSRQIDTVTVGQLATMDFSV